MDIIRRNFFRLLRAGVLGEPGEMEPMSAFKWKRLATLLREQKVLPLGVKGIATYAGDIRMNMQPELIAQLQEEATGHENIAFRAEPKLANLFLNNRLKHIRENERHAIDTSVETLHLLDIIVSNINHTMSEGLSLQGILEIGHYLRSQGHRVDFVKLDTWIMQLHIRNMASIFGTILVELFEFEEDEVPFMQKSSKKATSLMVKSLQDDGRQRHARQHFFLSQPLETSSRFVRNIQQFLSQIEE